MDAATGWNLGMGFVCSITRETEIKDCFADGFPPPHVRSQYYPGPRMWFFFARKWYVGSLFCKLVQLFLFQRERRPLNYPCPKMKFLGLLSDTIVS